MSCYNIDTQKDIVLATMVIRNYIKQKFNIYDAFQTTEDERYIPSVDRSSSTNNIEENMKEQSGILNGWGFMTWFLMKLVMFDVCIILVFSLLY